MLYGENQPGVFVHHSFAFGALKTAPCKMVDLDSAVAVGAGNRAGLTIPGSSGVSVDGIHHRHPTSEGCAALINATAQTPGWCSISRTTSPSSMVFCASAKISLARLKSVKRIFITGGIRFRWPGVVYPHTIAVMFQVSTHCFCCSLL